MKDIPIFIVNRDRLMPLYILTENLLSRGYNNITILDNGSTYRPLLSHYQFMKDFQGIKVFNTPNDIEQSGAVLNVMRKLKIEPFYSITQKNWYVYSDSDVYPVKEVPSNFIEDFIEFAEATGANKVGPKYKVDDIPDHYPLKDVVQEYEPSLVSPPTPHTVVGDTKLWHSPIDTTFAVHRPGTQCDWVQGGHALRADDPYVFKHAPWYYDPTNLPTDEKYYMKHCDTRWGYGWTSKIMDKVNLDD